MIAVLAPNLPRREQFPGACECKLAAVVRAFFKPLGNGILVSEVILGGFPHSGWRCETDALPSKAPVDAPAQTRSAEAKEAAAWDADITAAAFG